MFDLYSKEQKVNATVFTKEHLTNNYRTEQIQSICNFAKFSVQFLMCAPLLGRFDHIG